MFTAALLVWSIAAVFIRIVGLIVRELSLEARSAYTILPFSVVVLDGLLEDLAFARRYQCLSVGINVSVLGAIPISICSDSRGDLCRLLGRGFHRQG